MADVKKIIRSDCLSTDRVNGQFEDDLILCPICTNILWKPVACITCENCFCLNCIRLWLNEKANSCPFNCFFRERKPPGIQLKLLSKLKLDCENKSNGCPMVIRYEALEKHQLRECDYRLIQCSSCSEEMLFKDYEKHREESCLSKELICLKCSTVYQRNEGHIERQCLEKQIAVLQEKIQRSGTTFTTVNESLDKLTQSYKKLVSNEAHAKMLESNNPEEDFAPSAPFEEPFPTPSAPPAEEQPSTANTNLPSTGHLRISTVNFNFIRGGKPEGDHISNGYAGFNWENAYYIFEEYVKEHFQLRGYLASFTNTIKCVAYNGRGNPLSLYLPNPSNSFSLNSFEAMSVYYARLQISVTGFRSNVPVFIKHHVLDRSLKTFQINFERIDKVTFTPTAIEETTMKPLTFALIHLNFIF